MGHNIFTEEDLDRIDLDDIDLDNTVWVPAEPKVREKLFRAQHEGIIDFTNAKRSEIKDLLFQRNNMKVHEFIIRIVLYHGAPSEIGAGITMDVTIYREETKISDSGTVSIMSVPFDICQDDRFYNCRWISHFTSGVGFGSVGSELTPDTLMDIIRWIQVVKKLPAFL